MSSPHEATPGVPGDAPRIPDVPVAEDEWNADGEPFAVSMDIAFAFAAAGLYVLPVADTGDAKHAGSVVGKGWPAKSSSDADQVAAWFAGTGHRCALHCGRSGLVVLDIDHPDQAPALVLKAERELRPPTQYTRPREQRRHLVFAMPPGRRIGNSTGALGKGWGDTRGANGIIIVGGRGRRWENAGLVPVLPDYLAALLPDAGDTETAVSDTEIRAFIDAHRLELHPTSVEAPIRGFTTAVAAGESRHAAAVEAACWITRDAISGRYSAQYGLRRLADEFTAAMAAPRGPEDRAALTRVQAESEFRGVAAWAIGQSWRWDGTTPADEVTDEDPAAHMRERLREIRVADRVEALAVNTEAKRRHDAAQHADRPAIVDGLIDVADLDQIEPPRMLVARLIPDGAVGFLAGRSGSYKTFLAVAWACAIATGRAWLGFDEFAILRPLRVLYIAAEGAAGAALRIRAWQRVYGAVPAGRLTVYPRPVRLNDPDHIAELDALIEREGYEFVVIDTFHRSAPGVDENSSTDVGVVFETAAGLRDRHSCGVLFVDHTGHAGERLRGSSPKGDDADYVLTASYDGQERGMSVQRTLTVTKLKDEVDGISWPLRLDIRADAPAPVIALGTVHAAGETEFAASSDRRLIDAVAALSSGDDPVGWARRNDIIERTGRRQQAVIGDLNRLIAAGVLRDSRVGQSRVFALASRSQDQETDPDET